MFIFSFYQNVKSPYTRIAYMHSPPTSTAYTRFLSHIPDAKIHPYGLIDNRLASLNLIHEALFRICERENSRTQPLWQKISARTIRPNSRKKNVFLRFKPPRILIFHGTTARTRIFMRRTFFRLTESYIVFSS